VGQAALLLAIDVCERGSRIPGQHVRHEDLHWKVPLSARPTSHFRGDVDPDDPGRRRQHLRKRTPELSDAGH
jgi:hypothetical protein